MSYPGNGECMQNLFYLVWQNKRYQVVKKKKKKKKKEEEEEEEEGSLSLERESLHLLTNYTKINLEATRFSHQLQII